MTLAPLPARPLVSVVMIFHEAVRFLDEAAGSVLRQTWPAVELVLVDDGGLDGSDALARRLAEADPRRVRLLQHAGRANRGTGASRLLGIEAARGELVAFLDADDVWQPGHLEHEVALLAAHPQAGMVCGRAVTWRSWADPAATDELSPLAFPPGRVVAPPAMLTAVLRHGAVAVPTCSLLVRTDVLRPVAAAAAGFASTYEDQVLNTVLQVRTTAVMSGTTTAWYRQHPDSLSAHAMRVGVSAASGTSVSRMRFLRWLDALPELAPGRADPDLRAVLDRVLREQAGGPARVRATWQRASRAVVPAPARAAVRRARDLRGAPGRAAGRVATGGAATGGAATGGEDPSAVLPRVSPVHAAYTARFLHRWGEDLCGRVAELGGAGWSAAAERPVPVEQVAELEDLALGAYDCLLVPQALADAGDPVVLVRALRDRLRPGGALLAVLPGVRRVPQDSARPARVWTAPSAATLFAEAFSPALTCVDQVGNARAAAAALRGGRAPRPEVLRRRDPAVPLLVTVRALADG